MVILWGWVFLMSEVPLHSSLWRPEGERARGLWRPEGESLWRSEGERDRALSHPQVSTLWITPQVDTRLPRCSNSHAARPVHRIISIIRWIWTSRLSIKNSLSMETWG